MFKDVHNNLISELMSLPTQNYWVKFIYVSKLNPGKKLYLEFPQYDSEPYFPRVNRFYEFCMKNMKMFNFLDYEVIEYNNEIPRYQVDIEKEYTIH
tara:strand:- start:287 stop:574 length:288 start_codon:yes stop_codon:yes gene_type:complete